MAAVSKAEYLKRYMSDEKSTEKKKKKRKKIAATAGRSRIIDDDVDFKSLLPSNLENPLEEDVGDNDPTIAEIIDERPKHIQELELYRQSGQWKILGQDAKKEEFVLQFGEMKDEESAGRKQRHDSDSDASPPRPGSNSADGTPSKLPAKRRHDSESDASPPRMNSAKRETDSARKSAGAKSRQRHDSDSDRSPPRDGGSVLKATRASGMESARHAGQGRGRHDSDSDPSPPRRRNKSEGGSALRGRARPDSSSSDASPPRRRDGKTKPPLPKQSASSGRLRERLDSDSDASPPRKSRKLDGDSSPPRKNSASGKTASRGRGRHDSDGDLSPPRRTSGAKKVGSGSRERHDSDSDLSPPRQPLSGSGAGSGGRRRKQDSDSSPPWRTGPGEMQKAARTLGGAKAGLSSSKEMKAEAERLKRLEDEELRKIGAERLGAGSKTVFRDKSGKRRDLRAEAETKKLEDERKAQEQAKFQAWGKGLKQQAEREQTLAEHMHELSKPLARYKDDEDLDAILRARERDGDPMAAYMQKKKSKTPGNVPEKPRYSGPAGPPNRFGIHPGYRWDGVDRSNGFEKQLFAKQAEKRAVKEMAYKWSVEDM